MNNARKELKELIDAINKILLEKSVDKRDENTELLFDILTKWGPEKFNTGISYIGFTYPEAIEKLYNLINIDEIKYEINRMQAAEKTGYENHGISKEDEDDDPSLWNNRRLEAEIDAALDSNDYERVKELSQYLKECKGVIGYKYWILLRH